MEKEAHDCPAHTPKTHVAVRQRGNERERKMEFYVCVREYGVQKMSVSLALCWCFCCFVVIAAQCGTVTTKKY